MRQAYATGRINQVAISSGFKKSETRHERPTSGLRTWSSVLCALADITSTCFPAESSTTPQGKKRSSDRPPGSHRNGAVISSLVCSVKFEWASHLTRRGGSCAFSAAVTRLRNSTPIVAGMLLARGEARNGHIYLRRLLGVGTASGAGIWTARHSSRSRSSRRDDPRPRLFLVSFGARVLSPEGKGLAGANSTTNYIPFQPTAPSDREVDVGAGF